jgi:hypothetical protein
LHALRKLLSTAGAQDQLRLQLADLACHLGETALQKLYRLRFCFKPLDDLVDLVGFDFKRVRKLLGSLLFSGEFRLDQLLGRDRLRKCLFSRGSLELLGFPGDAKSHDSQS